MSAKQNGPGFAEQALFLRSVMLKVALKGGGLTTKPGRAGAEPRTSITPRD